MSVIIHISDTHFGTEVASVVEALQQTIHTLQPDIIILSGDITQRATSAQFNSAAEFMNNLPAKTKLVIPGNHDIPLFNVFKRFLTPYGNYKNAFGERQGIWSDSDITILCYDATSPLRHTNGKLTAKSVRALTKQITPASLIIACAHQPLVTAWPEDADETLINREETALLWSQNNIDLALSGHVHVPLITTTEKHFPTLPRHFILAGAGTAISHRIRPGARNSFNVIVTSDKDKFSITHYSFEDNLKRFSAMHPEYFVRAEKGWIAA